MQRDGGTDQGAAPRRRGVGGGERDLVVEEDVLALRGVSRELRVGRRTLITPLARETALRLGIEIVVEDRDPDREAPAPEGRGGVAPCPSSGEAAPDALVAAGAERLGGRPGLGADGRALAALIDHTLLKPDAVASAIDRLCEEAATWGFASVCVNPIWVARCRSRLAQVPVRVGTVVGFPLGANLPEVKALEARRAQDEGASELDMVIPVGLLKSGRHDLVADHVAAVVAARDAGHLVKVIIETCLLTDGEKEVACRIARDAGADFVKTSTGFSGPGATVDDVRLMRRIVGPTMGVKASGGIRTGDVLRALVAAGANRIGASAGVRIIAAEEHR